MTGWQDIDPQEQPDEEPKATAEPFAEAKAAIDPIVFVQTDSNPELRWDPSMVPKRPAPAPKPVPVSTGRKQEPWVPGGAPVDRASHTHARTFGKVVRVAAGTMLPLGLLAAIAVLVARAYGIA